jgi:hypothetical protein
MIRAVVKDGMIHPLDPLPPAWSDGQQVVIEEADVHAHLNSREDDNWYQEMAVLTAELDDPQEWEHIESILAEADRQAKELVRHEMGLP